MIDITAFRSSNMKIVAMRLARKLRTHIDYAFRHSKREHLRNEEENQPITEDHVHEPASAVTGIQKLVGC